MRFTCTPRLGRLPLVVLGFVMIILNLDSSKWSINKTEYDCSAADSPGCSGGGGLMLVFIVLMLVRSLFTCERGEAS